MMLNKRLIAAVGESKKYIAANVVLQWLALVANIAMMGAIAALLQGLYAGEDLSSTLLRTAVVAAAALAVRYGCSVASARMSYLSSKMVKRTLREKIYQKLLRLGASYKEQVNTSQVVQVAVEGVDQLETYFGAYLPQFFYAMLAPLTLFGVLAFINLPSAAVLLVCVPLIPVTIAGVQRWAKKLLAKYWGQYTALGDTFLENLQGLTTTKIYQADGFKHQEMNQQSEHFRKITMKVLTMQLNSIAIMDLIAYGGAALGAILAVTQFRAGRVDLAGCIMILLLAADFFLPMRLLGSYFHIAMNGMAASDKIFRLLDLPEPEQKTQCVPQDPSICMEQVCFSYQPGREVLHAVDMEFPQGSFTALVGGVSLDQLSEQSLNQNITYISHQSYLFKGTVRENLLLAAPQAEESALWQVLEQVRLADFLRSGQGLDTPVAEQGSNLSGGQRQRLALARALLHDSPVYLFDEATSNIDVESENDIMALIHALAKKKTVILISHRLVNAAGADRIYVMEKGRVVESGKHDALLAQKGLYARLWNAQQELEQYTKKVGDAV